MKDVEALEIDVGPIHHVKGIGLRQNLIENVHVMNLAVSNLNERGDGAAYVEQSVHLHGAFSRSESSARKRKRQSRLSPIHMVIGKETLLFYSCCLRPPY